MAKKEVTLIGLVLQQFEKQLNAVSKLVGIKEEVILGFRDYNMFVMFMDATTESEYRVEFANVLRNEATAAVVKMSGKDFKSFIKDNAKSIKNGTDVVIKDVVEDTEKYIERFIEYGVHNIQDYEIDVDIKNHLEAFSPINQNLGSLPRELMNSIGFAVSDKKSVMNKLKYVNVNLHEGGYSIKSSDSHVLLYRKYQSNTLSFMGKDEYDDHQSRNLQFSELAIGLVDKLNLSFIETYYKVYSSIKSSLTEGWNLARLSYNCFDLTNADKTIKVIVRTPAENKFPDINGICIFDEKSSRPVSNKIMKLYNLNELTSYCQNFKNNDYNERYFLLKGDKCGITEFDEEACGYNQYKSRELHVDECCKFGIVANITTDELYHRFNLQKIHTAFKYLTEHLNIDSVEVEVYDTGMFIFRNHDNSVRICIMIKTNNNLIEYKF